MPKSVITPTAVAAVAFTGFTKTLEAKYELPVTIHNFDQFGALMAFSFALPLLAFAIWERDDRQKEPLEWPLIVGAISTGFGIFKLSAAANLVGGIAMLLAVAIVVREYLRR